ncbi:hypothetical protein AgCh_029359 [Apium graveolens]
MTIGLSAREPRDRVGLGSDEAKIMTGHEVVTRDPFLLTDRPLEDVTQKHLDKVISVQVFILNTISDKARISASRVTEFIYSIVKNDGSEIPMKKNPTKLEEIMKEKCMCYNEDSSHPRVIRLNDGLERNHISALRTAIYQIGSQNEEMKQVKTTLSQVLRIKEEKLISSFVKNHYGFRLTQFIPEEDPPQDALPTSENTNPSITTEIEEILADNHFAREERVEQQIGEIELPVDDTLVQRARETSAKMITSHTQLKETELWRTT